MSTLTPSSTHLSTRAKIDDVLDSTDLIKIIVDSAEEFFALTQLKRGVRYMSRDGLAWDIVEAGNGHFDHPNALVGIKVVPTNGCFFVEAFGAVGNSTSDCSAAFSAASNAAQSLLGSGVVIKVCARSGRFRLNTTVAFNNISFEGVGFEETTVIPGMTDGSPCMHWTGVSDTFSLSNFRVSSSVASLNNYVAGSSNAQNCRAIVIGDPGVDTANRIDITNVGAAGCFVGWEVYGFIITGTNVWATRNNLGFKGELINSSFLNLRLENNRKGFEIKQSDGIHLDQLIEEGMSAQYGYEASTIDGVRGLVATAPYFERVVSGSFLKVGFDTLCVGIELIGISLASGGSGTYDANTFAIEFDKVDGVKISGMATTGNRHSVFGTTSNTINLHSEIKSLASSIVQERGNQLAPARNFFANPNFHLWLRGWPALTVVRGSYAREVSLTRTGKNSIRLTAGVGETVATTLSFTHNDGRLAANLAGKLATLYAWVWIPDTAQWDANATTSQTNRFSVSIFTNGTGGTTTASTNHHTVRGAWNLFKVASNVPADATRIDAIMSLHVPSGATGNEFVAIDSVYLIEGDGKDFKVVNGNTDDMSGVQILGDRMIAAGTASPTSTTMMYALGDIVYNANPTAGGSIGWVCTAAGSPGTWKSFGAISA
jgi:hypothetical protein